MRPLPAWPTNTFQSLKVATKAGLAASSFFSVFAAGLAGLVAAVTGGASALAAQAAAPTSPMARRDERTRRVIDKSFEPGPSPAGGLPCRPIGAKFRPFALPARAEAAIL